MNDYVIREHVCTVTQTPVFEVWGRNPATGYEWLIAEYNTRTEARMMIQYWKGAE